MPVVANPSMSISVCIATCRRAPRLDLLLGDLERQRLLPAEVVVVDNDREGSARAVVEARRAGAPPFRLAYAIEAEKNISLARNRSVEMAAGEWLAFVDDDERAPEDWLQRLASAAREHGADGVLGPVVPQVPESAPAWIRRGAFYDFPRSRTGEVVRPNRLRLGNAIFRAALFSGPDRRFDPAYGLTGGEDNDLLGRFQQAGARITWCDEACVLEPVEPARLTLRWLLLRALRGGQDLARNTRAGRYGPATAAHSTAFLLRAAGQACLASALAALTLPAGRHVAARWLISAAANVGKLSGFAGFAYREYA
jgi:succinoglycan biosynthesis protein ExoM